MKKKLFFMFAICVMIFKIFINIHLNLKIFSRSKGMDDILIALGVNKFARMALSRCTPTKVILVEGDTWTEDTTTSVITHRQVLKMDGSVIEAPYVGNKNVIIEMVIMVVDFASFGLELKVFF